jgi:small subunit ribosomal protein S6
MNYESTFICSPELSAEKVEELTSKVAKLVESSKGTVKTVQQLGKKRLAYPISKFREGSYVYMELSGEGDMIGAIENFFKLNDSVVRFLTVKVEAKKKVASKTAQAKTEQAQPEQAQPEQAQPSEPTQPAAKPAAQENAAEGKNESANS